ncbi:MAG: hypothetical protein ACJ72O_12465 [Marmoricola sp.]|jgi:hypothetical protein
MPDALMLVFSSPTSGETDEEFNRWYTDRHIQDIANLPGVVAATRYRMEPGIDVVEGVADVTQPYLAVYELKAETRSELESFAEVLRTALGDGRADMHTALDLSQLAGGFALPISGRAVPDLPAVP